MSGETEQQVSGWTVDTLRFHLYRVNELEDKFHTERDRRYAEVALEREKALKIKETADLAALQLAREIQTYKDEKANELREQINNERGLYATKEDVTTALREVNAIIRPLAEYVTTQQGRSGGQQNLVAYAFAAATLVVSVILVLTR